MPGKYVRSYIKTFHIRNNRHYSINATKHLILRESYWWPTIAEDLSLFITLCIGCRGKGEELATDEDPPKPSTAENSIHHNEVVHDWRTPYIEYLTDGEIKVGTLTRREHVEVVRRSKFFTIKDGKIRKLEKKGSTRECIAGDQIK